MCNHNWISTFSIRKLQSLDITQLQKMHFQSLIEQSLPLILVYYRFRGQLQPIRNLYCYLQLPFLEIHLDHFEEQKHLLSPIILNHIRKFKVEKHMLPVLIHGNFMVEGQLCIVNYTVRRFNRADLLGTNIRMRSRLQEILEIYFAKQPQSMVELLNISEIAYYAKSDQDMTVKISQVFDRVMKSSKYLKQLCQFLDLQEDPKYIFGELTLIDFFFFESCSYMLGCFDSYKRVNQHELENWNQKNCNFLDKPNAYYMNIIKKYKMKMKEEPWYLKNQQYLESFSIINGTIPPEKVIGLKKMWVGNPKFVV